MFINQGYLFRAALDQFFSRAGICFPDILPWSLVGSIDDPARPGVITVDAVSVSQPLGGRSSAPVLLAHRPRDGSWHASEATFPSGVRLPRSRGERDSALVLQIAFRAPRKTSRGIKAGFAGRYGCLRKRLSSGSKTLERSMLGAQTAADQCAYTRARR